jgi:hypothetical protein
MPPDPSVRRRGLPAAKSLATLVRRCCLVVIAADDLFLTRRCEMRTGLSPRQVTTACAAIRTLLSGNRTRPCGCPRPRHMRQADRDDGRPGPQHRQAAPTSSEAHQRVARQPHGLRRRRHMREYVPSGRGLGERIKVSQREHGERAGHGQQDAHRERGLWPSPPQQRVGHHRGRDICADHASWPASWRRPHSGRRRRRRRGAGQRRHARTADLRPAAEIYTWGLLTSRAFCHSIAEKANITSAPSPSSCRRACQPRQPLPQAEFAICPPAPS